MSNTSKGAANKGSKFQMQRITLPENKTVFDKFVNDELQWLSPLIEDKFTEYRMNSPYLLGKLGISQPIKKKYINSFWPSPQPQWDGIAIGKENTLYLFEAKSHLSEIVPGKDGNIGNDELKYSSIMTCAKELFSIEDTEENRKYWCKTFYQISNRIAFAHQLTKISKVENVEYNDVKMVFLNFVNDATWLKDKIMVKNDKEWLNHYEKKILPKLGISIQKLNKNNVYILNFDLNLLI
ncbi:MAG: hypothetical protein IKX36_11180 [Prevotella sp.]|nr:hypothetical protein [Prevotella sp.]